MVFGATPQPDVADVTISILMPVYNTPPDLLDAAIRSVLCQTYPNWELCICDDASTSAQTHRTLAKFKGIDHRLKIYQSPTNLNIAGATNAAAEFATGNFIAFLDHDDTLEFDALEQIVAEIRTNPDADVLYTDEDKIEPNGAYSEPYMKPDWSPEHLTSVMYLLHMLVVRKSLFLDLGGLRNAYSGAQDYDLALRATARARRVVHIPRVLYHWRKIDGSAAAALEAKPQALVNAGAALADFVKPYDATVERGLFPGSFRVRWPIDKSKPVTLVILTNSRYREVEGRGRILLAEHFVRSILAKTTYPNIRILVVDDGKMPASVRDDLIGRGVAVEPYKLDGPFNFARKLNYALTLVKTDDVIILNDDMEVIAPDWVEALLEQSRRPEIGAVGARLLFANGSVQHAGVVLGVQGSAGHIFHQWPGSRIAYCGFSHVVRNYSAVTAAVLATRMNVIRRVGGFDEDFAVDYNDIDFCLKVRAAGYRIVYTPFAELYHFEASSLVRSAPNEADAQSFRARWANEIDADPHYSPHLPRHRNDCTLEEW